MQTCQNGRFRLVLVLSVATLLIETGYLHAHDDLAWQMLAGGDASRAEWFETLRTPSGEPCCSLSDCRQTRAEWRGDTGGWWVLVGGAWRPVPADKVLTSPKSIDGAAYLCSGRDSRGNPDGDTSASGNVTLVLGAIYCFVPPDLGS
jgi:hypothetical protein